MDSLSGLSLPLPANWASPEDFATLFQYFWHRDFPIDPLSIGDSAFWLDHSYWSSGSQDSWPVGVVAQHIDFKSAILV